MIDKDQTLWIGTYSAGVNYHSPFYRPGFLYHAKRICRHHRQRSTRQRREHVVCNRRCRIVLL
ncbi:MAG: hypothetical protein ACLR6J_13300 [Parabacteroides merdae]